MSVVGIDLGYQSCFVSVARHGGVETVANEYSDRASPSIVALSPTLRSMGMTAKNQRTTNFKNTIEGFKTLIGRHYSDPVVHNEMKRQHYAVEQLPGDQIGIKVQYVNEEHTFSPSQVTAMMLGYLKGVGAKALAKPITDCVVAVPSYFTDAQRRAVLDATSIAGLNCLRLMNETTAVALAYGIYKQDLPEEKEKSRNVVFVDMGHHSLQVVICAFNKGKLKVLSKAFDPMLGGRDFDRRLVEHFAKEFQEKYKVDTFSKSKAVIRLTTECEKLKKLMSANSTPIPINIECFIDDKDVTGRLKRADFEELCSDLFVRVKEPLVEALVKSGLKLEDIHSVEVVGGCSRVPAIKDIISSVFQQEIKTTMNLDEAVARGCALQCAILSPTFKVRDFSIHDIQPYPIQLTWENNGEKGEMTVFEEGDQVYHSKLLTFYRKADFDLAASYIHPTKIPFKDPFIGTFRVKGVKPTDEGESSKLKIKVRLSIHGTFIIKSAVMIEKQIQEVVEVMDTDAPPTDPAPSIPNSESKDEKEDTPQEQQGDNPPGTEEPPAEEKMEVNGNPEPQTTDPQSSDPKPDPQTEEGGAQVNGDGAQVDGDGAQVDEGGAQTTPDTSSTKQPTPKKQKKTFKQIDLPVDENTYSLKKKYLDDAFEKECKMAQQDKLEIEKSEAKNNVEEYVYEMRDKISMGLENFINEQDKETYQSLLSATEEWLYDEGEDQPKNVYQERLKELKKTGDMLIERERESRLRPGAYEVLAKTIVHYEKIYLAYEAKDEKYEHLTKEDMDKVKAALETKRHWMTTQMQLSDTTPLSADPPVKVITIQTATKDLNNVCNPIVTKPKPKVEPPKDEGVEDKKKGEEPMEDDKKGEGPVEDKKGEESAAGNEGAGQEQGTADVEQEQKFEDMDVD